MDFIRAKISNFMALPPRGWQHRRIFFRSSLAFVMVAALLLESAGVSLVSTTVSSDLSAAEQLKSAGWHSCKGDICGCISTGVSSTDCWCHKPSKAHRESSVTEDLADGRAVPNDRVVFRVVIQSSSCTGRSTSFVLRSVVRIAESPQVLVVSDSCLHYSPTDASNTYISHTISPDPPPPRTAV